MIAAGQVVNPRRAVLCAGDSKNAAQVAACTDAMRRYEELVWEVAGDNAALRDELLAETISCVDPSDAAKAAFAKNEELRILHFKFKRLTCDTGATVDKVFPAQAVVAAPAPAPAPAPSASPPPASPPEAPGGGGEDKCKGKTGVERTTCLREAAEATRGQVAAKATDEPTASPQAAAPPAVEPALAASSETGHNWFGLELNGGTGDIYGGYHQPTFGPTGGTIPEGDFDLPSVMSNENASVDGPFSSARLGLNAIFMVPNQLTINFLGQVGGGMDWYWMSNPDNDPIKAAHFFLPYAQLTLGAEYLWKYGFLGAGVRGQIQWVHLQGGDNESIASARSGTGETKNDDSDVSQSPFHLTVGPHIEGGYRYQNFYAGLFYDLQITPDSNAEVFRRKVEGEGGESSSYRHFGPQGMGGLLLRAMF